MKEYKTFYHPQLMPSDSLKVLLGVRYRGEINSFQDHVLSLTYKVSRMIEKALEDGEHVPDLVENYLGLQIEDGDWWDLTCSIMVTPYMEFLISHAYSEWIMIDFERKALPFDVLRAVNGDGALETKEAGQLQTEELLEDMSLRYFLEHLSIVHEYFEGF